MDNHQLLEMIDHYLAGTATAEEISRLQAWLDALHTGPGLSAHSPAELKQMADHMFSIITGVLDARPDENTRQP